MNIIDRMNFREFIELNELFAAGEPPKEGKWEGDTFYFNVPEDPRCANIGSNYCYRVDFVNDYDDGVGISFRPTYGNYKATGANVQSQVGQGVTYALGEYIKQHSPKKLHWSPVVKSHDKKNGEARRHVYALWMRRNLFPDQYVPWMPGDPTNPEYPSSWIRRDEYDKLQAQATWRVQKGLLKLPSPGDTTISKNHLYNQMATAQKDINEKEIQASSQQRRDLEQRNQRQREEEQNQIRMRVQQQQDLEQTNQRQRDAERNQAIMRLVSNPQINPAKIGIGDVVQSRYGTYWHRGKVSGFQISHNGGLEVIVTDKKDSQNQPIESTWTLPDDEPIGNIQKISAGMFGKEKLSR